MKAMLFILLCTLNQNTLANQHSTDNAFTELANEIKTGKYPHILAAKISTGLEPKSLVEVTGPQQHLAQTYDIRSATKSITALLFGLEILATPTKSTLFMHDLTQQVGKILPDIFSNSALHKEKITLFDLMTMRSGLACNDWQPSSVGHEDKMYLTEDWTDFWASQPLSHQSGAHFSYCTGNAIALGQVLTKGYGENAEQLAKTYLFDPMNIKQASWAKTPEGGIDTGGHLALSVVDMHKIGLLVLNRGLWQGNQLVSAEWIDLITLAHTHIEDRAESYGLLWWITKLTTNNKTYTVHYAHGNGGNFIVIIPKLELVAAFLGNAFNSREQFIPFKLLRERVIPEIDRTQSQFK
jgi:CubicO group peptidase (beta-lactamase class C family)